MKRITIVYYGGNAGDHALETPTQRTLQGQRVGYGFNPPEEDRAIFRIWADGPGGPQTFGIPFGRMVNFEIEEIEGATDNDG